MRNVPHEVRRLAIALLGAASLALACARPPEPAASGGEDDVAPEQPEARGSEWLYVTQRVHGGRAEECRHVASNIEAESRCNGPLCAHSASLVEDFLRLCPASIDGSRRAELERQLSELRGRAERHADPCVEPAISWLRDGCGKEAACAADVQRWATDCGEKAATPLVIAMLEQLIEQSFGDRHSVHLDPRSCATLAQGVRAAARCESFDACQRALPELEAYTSRCSPTPRAALAPAEAVAVTLVRLGAEQPTPPIALVSRPTPLEEGVAPIVLANRRGAVLRVCGARVSDLGSYLDARRRCSDGDLVLAMVFETAPTRELRVLSVPHPDDARFARRFPSLYVAGEDQRRDAQRMSQLEKSIEDAMRAAATGSSEDALARLTRALATMPRAALDPPDAARIAARFDARMARACSALGAAKAKALRNGAGRELVPFFRRAEVLPLADVSAEGRIVPGSASPPSLLEVSSFPPSCVSAYRRELLALETRLMRVALSPEDVAQLSARVAELTESCARASARAVSQEAALLRCAGGLDTCDDDAVSSLEAALDGTRIAHEEAWVQARLAVASLPAGSRPAAETALRQKCPD